MNIINWFKNTYTVLKEAGKIKEYEKISFLTKNNAILEADNKKLRDELEVKENLVSEGNVYWIIKDGKKDGPFCTCCWDSEHIKMRLHKSLHIKSLNCPKCKTVAEPGEYQNFKQIDQWKNSNK